MGCGSCGTSKDGAPSGCQSHGNCASGGCNRMNVHDWLANLPFADPESNCKIVEVSFNNGSRKFFFKNLYSMAGLWATPFCFSSKATTKEVLRIFLLKFRLSSVDCRMISYNRCN